MEKIYIRPEISVMETCADNLLHDVSAVKLFDNTGKLIYEIEVVEDGMPSDAELGDGDGTGGVNDNSKFYSGDDIWE